MKPAGLDKSKGVITAVYGKDPTDPRWKDDPGFKEWDAFVANICRRTDLNRRQRVLRLRTSRSMVQVLKQCGNDLSRDNIMRQALSLKDFATADAAARHNDQHLADQLVPIRQFPLQRFNGENWELFGDVLMG